MDHYSREVLPRYVDEGGHLIPPLDVDHHVPKGRDGVVHILRLHHADLSRNKIEEKTKHKSKKRLTVGSLFSKNVLSCRLKVVIVEERFCPNFPDFLYFVVLFFRDFPDFFIPNERGMATNRSLQICCPLLNFS